MYIVVADLTFNDRLLKISHGLKMIRIMRKISDLGSRGIVLL